MTSISLNLCLSEIPNNFIRKGKNGKLYVNLLVFKKKEVGQFGETHAVKISKTAEEMQIDTKNIYVGSGKEFEIKEVTADKLPENELPEWMRKPIDNPVPPPMVTDVEPEENKDLPF